MNSIRCAESWAGKCFPLCLVQIRSRVLRILSATGIAMVTICISTGDIGKATAQDKINININNHLVRAKEIAEKAIGNEKESYERMKSLDVLILEGDSWFNLPFHADIAEELENLNYAVMSGAEPGDTLENMAFGGQLSNMAAQFRRLSEFDKENRKPPKAILLSAGGNDILGPNFEFLLHHSQSMVFKQSGNNQRQEEILRPALKRIQSYLLDYIVTISEICTTLYSTDLESVQADCSKIPIIVHGYDCPIPSGEGYSFLGLFSLKGPWLRPAFRRKMQENMKPGDILAHFIDEHNKYVREAVEVLKEAVENPVCYLNLRGEVQDWSDELHPAESGMEEIARKFDSVIKVAADGKCPAPVENRCLQ